METTIKAGKYWIGDPCYYISDDNWDDVCNQIYDGASSSIDGMFINADGKEFIVIRTRWGDGCYALNNYYTGRVANLGVDAGLLSIIPVSLDTPLGKKSGGIVIELEKDVPFSADNGDFVFGDYSVNTSGDGEEDEDYDGEEDEDYDDDDVVSIEDEN